MGGKLSASSRSPKGTARSGSQPGGASSTPPKLSLAVSVDADEKGIHVILEDGRVVTAPLTERLKSATPAQRHAGRVEGFGTALRWEEIDEDLGVNSVLGVSEDEIYELAGFTKYPQK